MERRSRERRGASATPRNADTTAPIPLLDAKNEDQPKTVDINITFPTLPKPPIQKVFAFGARFIKSHRRLSLIVVIALVGFGIYQFGFSNKTNRLVGSDAGGAKTEKVVQRPDYPTILPAGKTIESFGGWTRVSPPDRNPVFAYADEIDNTKFTVSQQPLPKEFQADTSGKTAELAQAYAATKKLEVDGVTVYLGKSAKGPQSLIFTKNELLVLIKASAVIPDEVWRQYISSLQ